jgi:ketosteroid isomerase-like protein
MTNIRAESLREENRAVAYAWMSTLGDPEWWNLMHDDIVFEFPYASSLGSQERVVGKTAAEVYAKTLFARLGKLRFSNLKITATSDPKVFFSEYETELPTASGGTYKQIYVNKLRFKDGKTVYMREFWDPKRIIDAAKAPTAAHA